MAGIRRLWFQRLDSIGQFPDGRVKLEVVFKDDLGGVYIWTPRWKEEVESLFLAGLRVEKTNKPQSDYLKSFAETARDAFREAASISEAYIIEGKLLKLEMNNFVLCEGTQFYSPEVEDFYKGYCESPLSAGDKCNHKFAVGIAISEDWLLANLNGILRCLVINGIVVRAEKEK